MKVWIIALFAEIVAGANIPTNNDRKVGNIPVERNLIDAGTLYDSLMTKYNKQVPPDMTQGPITVNFDLSLIDITDIDLAKGYGSFIVWEHMEWKDNRLVWDVDFSDVQSLTLDPDLLWIPDVILYKSKLSGDKIHRTRIVVHNTGDITWIPKAERVVPCHVSGNKTYDVECFFRYGSWTMDGFQVDLQSRLFDTSNFGTVLPYEITNASVQRNSMRYDCCPEPYVDLDFTLALKSLDKVSKIPDEDVNDI